MDERREKPKTDRRVLRTRQILRQSLMALAREKGYESVSVEEIAARADVGRATFYLHYRDKEDLLLDEFSEMARERVEQLAQIPFALWLPGMSENLPAENKPSPPFLMIFQHVAEHQELYRLLLQNQSSGRMGQRLREIVTESINTFVEAKKASDPLPLLLEIPADLLAAFFNGALVGSISWWLEHPEISVEEMTRMFQRMFLPGARKVMGIGKTG